MLSYIPSKVIDADVRNLGSLAKQHLLYIKLTMFIFLTFRWLEATSFLKPGLHEPQLPVERSVTLVSSIEVERRRCALQVSSVV